MRLVLTFIWCVLVGIPVAAQNDTRAAPGDEAAVRAIVKSYVEAREKKDPGRDCGAPDA